MIIFCVTSNVQKLKFSLRIKYILILNYNYRFNKMKSINITSPGCYNTTGYQYVSWIGASDVIFCDTNVTDCKYCQPSGNLKIVGNGHEQTNSSLGWIGFINVQYSNNTNNLNYNLKSIIFILFILQILLYII